MCYYAIRKKSDEGRNIQQSKPYMFGMMTKKLVHQILQENDFYFRKPKTG